MRSSVALVYLRCFVPERGLSLRAPILSLANRLSHMLTRAARVCIFKAICLPFSPLAARRITLDPLASGPYAVRPSNFASNAKASLFPQSKGGSPEQVGSYHLLLALLRY